MDNQNQQRERRKGAVDYINSLRSVNFALRTVGQIVTKPFPWVWIVVIIILLIVIFQLFFGGGTGFSFDLDDTDSNLPGGNGTGSIATCTFYRGDRLPSAVQYNSTTLIGYFEEAARISGVPASVLAAIVRVETPSLTNLTDSTLNTYSCPVSSAGAMGPMQIVAHYSSRTDAICRECIAVGADFLGKTVDELTQSDYCELRSGIILGAGFILKKMQHNFGTSVPTWDPAWTTSQDAMYKLANSFHGCLGYPNCTSGPYNYGEDVWNSVQYCRPSTGGPLAATDCPIDNGVITCGSLFTPINGPLGLCAHCGVGYNAPCNFPGTKYAIDIAGVDFTDVKLPKINNNIIKWTFFYEASRGSNEAIFGYAGEDPNTAGRYYLQLHHVAPGSQKNGTSYSGDIGAKICGNGCAKGHVHVQLGTGATSASTTTWIDVAQFFCRAQI